MQNWLNESLLSLDSCDGPEVFDFFCDHDNAESNNTAHPAGESFKPAREACLMSPPPFSLTCTDSNIFPSTSSRAHTPAPYPPSPYTHRYNPTPSGVVPSCSPAPPATPATPASFFYAAESPFADGHDLMCDLTNDGLASGVEDQMLKEEMLGEAEKEGNISYYVTDAVRGLSKVQTKGNNSMPTTSSTSSSSSSSTSARRTALTGPGGFLLDDHEVLLRPPRCPMSCPVLEASAMSVSEPTVLGDRGSCEDFAEHTDATATGVGMKRKNDCGGHPPKSTNQALDVYQVKCLSFIFLQHTLLFILLCNFIVGWWLLGKELLL